MMRRVALGVLSAIVAATMIVALLGLPEAHVVGGRAVAGFHGQAHTLAAAVEAGQEMVDRISAGDAKGEWELYPRFVREGVTLPVFVEFARVCHPPLTMHFSVAGARLDGPDLAIMRVVEAESGALVVPRFMVTYEFERGDEDGAWRVWPGDVLLANLGKNADDLIAASRTRGACLS